MFSATFKYTSPTTVAATTFAFSSVLILIPCWQAILGTTNLKILEELIKIL